MDKVQKPISSQVLKALSNSIFRDHAVQNLLVASMLADELKVWFYSKQSNGLYKSGSSVHVYMHIIVTVYNLTRIRIAESESYGGRRKLDLWKEKVSLHGYV
jgi:hypothetical protein